MICICVCGMETCIYCREVGRFLRAPVMMKTPEKKFAKQKDMELGRWANMENLLVRNWERYSNTSGTVCGSYYTTGEIAARAVRRPDTAPVAADAAPEVSKVRQIDLEPERDIDVPSVPGREIDI
jgi:hypothetical protein